MFNSRSGDCCVTTMSELFNILRSSLSPSRSKNPEDNGSLWKRRIKKISAGTKISCVALAAYAYEESRTYTLPQLGCGNSLPVSVTSAATLNTFKQRLKTELFIRCYDLPSSYARKHSCLTLYRPTAAQLVFFFFLLSVLAVFGLNATIIIFV